MGLDVYNLEFRCRSLVMDIAGYRFTRVPEYAERLQGLEHPVAHVSEYSILPRTGTHQITARVKVPEREPPSVLSWSNSQATALDDLILLLSIFTGRQVFVLRDYDPDEPCVLTADPRMNAGGGVLRCSIPYVSSPPIDKDDPSSTGDDGLQVHLNHVYDLMRTEEWRETYKDGYYLFLLRTALQERTIESALSQCWTIWEHLFSVLNEPWMSRNCIVNTKASEKIAFLLVKFGLSERLDESEKSRLRTLSNIRNRLVHFGQLSEDSHARDDAVLFTRLTEWIVAKTLGLVPSEVFDTLGDFEEFISRCQTTA